MLGRQGPPPRISASFSASANRGSEDVGILAIVVPELELCNVKRQVFGADFMESTYDAALEDAPEALNRIGANRADNVLQHGQSSRAGSQRT